MAAKPHATFPAVPAARRLPVGRAWTALAVGIGAVAALLLSQRAAGWPITLSALALFACCWLALAAGALLGRLLLAQRSLGRELAILERDYAALRRHLAGTAHDIRAPMVTINSYLELLAAAEFGSLPVAAQQVVEQAARASARVRVLVDATLATSTGDRDGACGPPSRVDLDVVLADVIVSLGADIARTQAQVSVGLLPAVRGNDAACYRIFENLVQNALRYPKAGAAPLIEITASERSDAVEIAVRDQGCGIDRDERERVFGDRVRGVHAACKGSGLGLATVRELVTSLGGSVWIDPDVTDGTCVRVRLPLAVAAALRSPAASGRRAL